MDSAPQEQMEMRAQQIARSIDTMMLPGWKFALVAYRLGNHPRSIYTSNINRQDMIKAFRELADKLENGAPEL